jgi:PDZ domain-containing protein
VLQPGDVIVGVDGEPVALAADATSRIGGHGPGDEVRLSVERAATPDAGHEDVVATLVAHPQDPSRGFLGVNVQTDELRYDFPVDVKIASERIGGPSAGLAFTLEVLDVLTDGDLTGGLDVAATGEILDGGAVGPVGGVAQKAVAVERAGVDVFLVPSSEVELARKYASDDLRIEPVDTLDDALAVLDELGGNALAIGKPATGEGA